MLERFGDLNKLSQLPSLKACQETIEECPALSNRTPAQLKTWIDNQRKDRNKKK